MAALFWGSCKESTELTPHVWVFPVKIEQVDDEQHGVSEIKRSAEEERGSLGSTLPPLRYSLRLFSCAQLTHSSRNAPSSSSMFPEKLHYLGTWTMQSCRFMTTVSFRFFAYILSGIQFWWHNHLVLARRHVSQYTLQISSWTGVICQIPKLFHSCAIRYVYA